MCILSIVLSSSGTLQHGDCLINIVSPLWECLSRRRLFSHGYSEVMHSACVCILSFVLSISGILLVIVSSTLILICGNGEVMYSSCVCTFITYNYTFRYKCTSGDCMIYTCTQLWAW